MDGAFAWPYSHWSAGDRTAVNGLIIDEGLVRLHVNGHELATLMCTPSDLVTLALGFLRSEGIIQRIQDVRLAHVCPSQTCVEVWLHDADVVLPSRAILTSGCGGGVTFDDLSQRAAPVASRWRVEPQAIFQAMHDMTTAASLYNATRGVHTSALSDGQRLVAVAEDVGRHNTIDRLWGHCLQQGINPADHMLVATGRISSEMLNKAAKMGIPVVASRTSPTSLSVRLAREWDILLIGYVRGHGFNIYAGDWRLHDDAFINSHDND